MKTTYKVLSMLVLSLGIVSCDSYLDSDSADLQIPKSVDDYAPLLLGEGYPDNIGSESAFMELMTDDVEMGPLYYDSIARADRYNFGINEGIDIQAGYGQYAHMWAQSYSQYLTDNYWKNRYNNILTCNAIIDALPTMGDKESKVGEYRKLAYQAYALRAFNYFCLVNTYAKPYTAENLNEPGVILKTAPKLGMHPTTRASIKDVYTLIDSDLEKAEDYINGANVKASKFEFTRAAVLFLATRVALFEGDWDKTIEKGEKFLKMNKSMIDLNDIDSSKLGAYTSSSGSDGFFVNNINYDETVWLFGRNDSYRNAHDYLSPHSATLYYYEYGFHTSWTDSNHSLISLYEEGDLRKNAYYIRPFYYDPEDWWPTYECGQYFPNKCVLNFSSTGTYCSQAWRTPEIYISLAEAYARKGNKTKALEYLNQLRIKKFKTGSANATKQASDFANDEELIQFIWDERRRELSFEENMRFWDMRRQGMPEQTHYIYSSVDIYTTYVLPQGSPNYVLPIPEDELFYNDGCVDNPRVVIANK